MQRVIRRLTCVLVGVGILYGCAGTTPAQKAAQAQAQAAGLSPTDSRFDGTFVAPGVNLAQYRKLLLEPLDVDSIEVRRHGGELRNTPWQLSDADKSQYRSRYLESVTQHLIADGRFESVVDPDSETVLLRSRIVQIAPLGSKDDFVGRPNGEKVYTEGMGTMTIEMTLFDAATGKVLAIITDRRELGNLWEENNRVTNAMHVRNAFNAWLGKLRDEWDRLTYTVN